MKRVAEHNSNDLETLVVAYNKDGMESLRKGQLKASLEQLKYSEVLCTQNQSKIHPSLLAVTLNNLGCYYRKTFKYNAALSYLRQALQIELSVASCDFTVAGTHLNVCAVLSKLEKHEKAMLHATCAMELLVNHIHNKRHKHEEIGIEEYSVLAIAYFNIAAEYEHLYLWDAALDAYHQGRTVAETYLGDNHSLTAALGKAKLASLKLCELHRRRAQKNASIRDRKRPLSSRAYRPKQTSRPYNRAESALSRPFRGAESALSRPYSEADSALSRPYSAVPRPPTETRALSRPHSAAPRLLREARNDGDLRRPPTRRGLSLAKPVTAHNDVDSVQPSSRDDPHTAQPLSREEQPLAMLESGEGGLPLTWTEYKVDCWKALDDDTPEVHQPSVPYSSHSTNVPTISPLCLVTAPAAPRAPPDWCSSIKKSPCDTMSRDATLCTSAVSPVMGYEGEGHPVPGEWMSQSELPRLPALTEMRVGDTDRSPLNPTAPSEPRTKAPWNIWRRDSLTRKRKENKETSAFKNSVWEELDECRDAREPSKTRSNRAIKGTSRTSMAQRQSYNTATAQIRARHALTTRTLWLSTGSQKSKKANAAKCIQRHWRASCPYHVHIAKRGAATKLQAVWRSYVVRRDRLYRAAVVIQKVARGVVVRQTRQRHTSASIIQARLRGALTRQSLQKQREKALVVQKRVRGNAGRRLFNRVKEEKRAAAVCIQQMYRKNSERAVRRATHYAELRECVALSMQKLYRASKGRKIVADIRRENARREHAAIKLQAEQRRRMSAKYVQKLRVEDAARKTSSADTIRKNWLRFYLRKHYLTRKATFAICKAQIIIIQRHARGCIVRAQLKRRLLQQQQVYNAACWIQHAWRGHTQRASRTKEDKDCSDRHNGAVCIQRYWRQWLAKARCARLRTALERRKIEERELNFRAAQKIQALRRGQIERRNVHDMQAVLFKCCINIQRVWRGHVYRKTMWDAALNYRAVIIQSTVRGFIARKRMRRNNSVEGMAELK